MALTSSNDYDTQTYVLLALLGLDILLLGYSLVIALATLCDARASTRSLTALQPAKHEARIKMNYALTQTWTCTCSLLANISLMGLLLEYVRFRTRYGERFRNGWLYMTLVPRLISLILTFWFRAYDRPSERSFRSSRLQCLNNNSWTMWLVGVLLTAATIWLAVVGVYHLYTTQTCADSSTGIMCSRYGAVIPLSIASVLCIACYAIFASVLTEYADETVLDPGFMATGVRTVNKAAVRKAQRSRCQATTIAFIGFFATAALVITAVMVYIPIEYDNDNRFEAARSDKPGVVLFLVTVLCTLVQDYLYIFHVSIKCTGMCCGGDCCSCCSASEDETAASLTGIKARRKRSRSRERNGGGGANADDLTRFTSEENFSRNKYFPELPSLGGLGLAQGAG